MLTSFCLKTSGAIGEVQGNKQTHFSLKSNSDKISPDPHNHPLEEAGQV